MLILACSCFFLAIEIIIKFKLFKVKILLLTMDQNSVSFGILEKLKRQVQTLTEELKEVTKESPENNQLKTAYEQEKH